MDTSLLQLFVAVMRRGGFSAVARDTGASPSAVSRAIGALEDELGVRLFQRTTRQVVPTEAAEAFLARVAPLVDGLEEAKQVARDAGQEPEGVVRVSAPAGFAQANLFPLLPGLVERYPGLSFDFLLTDAELDLVAERIDLAIRLWPFAESSYVASRLCPMNELVCAAPAYLERAPPLRAPPDLAGHRCVLFRLKGYRSEWRFRDPAGDVVEVPVQPRCMVTNALALKECTLLNLGPALVPRWMVGQELADGRLVRLFPEHAVTATSFDAAAAWMLFPSRAHLPLKVRVLADCLRQAFRHGAPGEKPLSRPA